MTRYTMFPVFSEMADKENRYAFDLDINCEVK